MDEFLAKASSQVVNLAIRSGITFAGKFAFTSLAKFMASVPDDGKKSNLVRINDRLQTKIQVVTPAIDLIELISARGNTSIESTLKLTQELKEDIDEFREKVDSINELVETDNQEVADATKDVEAYAKELLGRIEEAIPLISLALTTSGANLSSSLPDSVSPGRVLLASKHLTDADQAFDNLLTKESREDASDTHNEVKVGPSFCLKVYTVFAASAHNASLARKEVTWKEEHAKSRVQLVRVSNDDTKYAYELRIDEDFDDGRYHDKAEEPGSRSIDVSIITRLFFSASGQLLAIEESKSPVLVIKLNMAFHPSTAAVGGGHDFAARDGVEWLAFEIYSDEDSGASDDELSEDDEKSWVDEGANNEKISQDDLARHMEDLVLQEESPVAAHNRASLSLLEYLIRLSALQTNDQACVFDIHDERIALYLRDDSGRPSGSAAPGGVGSELSSPGSERRSISGGSPASRHRRRQRLGSPSVTPRRKTLASTHPSPLNDSLSTPTPTKNNSSSSPFTPWERDRLRRNPILSRFLSARNSPVKLRDPTVSSLQTPLK